MPRFLTSMNHWLENRWVAPAFAGWLLLAFTSFFFLAAINTMAGWLYVISGVSLSLLLVAAVLPVRSLRGMTIQRTTIPPVSAGDSLSLELAISNPTPDSKALFLIQDLVPTSFRTTPQQVIESLPAQASHTWRYQLETNHRGVYHWQSVSLRTAAPLGLFWCRRLRQAPAMAIVYPQVLNLQRCPLIDQLGQQLQQQLYNQSHQVRLATEGSTRSLRPYRRGDPLRLIHWRSSARYGELRVRELELATGGEDLVIALDCSPLWDLDNFEQAVIAAASLYFYARRYYPQVALWTGMHGGVQGERSVLRILAEITVALHRIYPQAEITGVDLSPYFLAIAQHRNADHPNIRWLHAAAEAPGLPQSSVDLVSLCLVCHELPQTASQSIFREARRLLRPGGHLAIMDMNPQSQAYATMPPYILTLLKSTEPYLDEYFGLDMARAIADAGFHTPSIVVNSPRHRTLIAQVC